MSTKHLLSQLLWFRRQFTALEHFNLESPIRMQNTITDVLAFLEKTEIEFPSETLEQSKLFLKTAHGNAKEFHKELKTDWNGYDVDATHPNPMFWYQEVIGYAESSMDLLINYLKNSY